MSVLIQVNYGPTYPDRAAIISALDAEPFVRFAQSSIAEDKEGEELIKLLTSHLSTNIESIARYCGNTYEDGPQGQPHKQHFDQGLLYKVEHYRNNLRNDGSYGEPAIQVFRWKDGYSYLHYSERYQKGLKHNGANGEPSIQSFDEKGALIWQVSYKNDQLINYQNMNPAYIRYHEDGKPQEIQWVDQNGEFHNGPNGEPAIQKWDTDGQEVYRASYNHGQNIHEIVTESQRDQELKDFLDNQVVLAEQSCPALKFSIDSSLLKPGSI